MKKKMMIRFKVKFGNIALIILFVSYVWILNFKKLFINKKKTN